MLQTLPPTLRPTGRTVRLLRAEIEAATGRAFAHGRGGARVFAQGFSAQGFSAQGFSAQGFSAQGFSAQGFSAQGFSAQGFAAPGFGAQGFASQGSGGGPLRPSALRGARLRVEPGPLLSPYDTPATGLSSLRLAWDGGPFGGGAPPPELADLLRRHRLFGGNRAPRDPPGGLPRGWTALALVEADLAAAPRRLRAFLARLAREAALRHPGERVLVAGPGGLPRGLAPLPPLHLFAAPVDPWALLPEAARVYVATPESACEARLAGAETVCLDDAAVPGTDALLARRYGDGVHWFDPWSRRPVSVVEAIEAIAWLRDRHAGTGARVVYVGISGWKRPALDVFGQGPYGPPLHAMSAEAALALARGCAEPVQVRAWATRAPAHLPDLCARAGLPFARVEDGFLRSVGLGASLRPGASIVVDDDGIYYDPRTPNRLARILAGTAFSPDLVARAQALREAIVALRLSKYNVGLSPAAPDWPRNRRIVLVPGQVEDDASVRYGAPRVASNLALLHAARARNPDAFLLYKPHPDVEAGFRPGRIPDAQALELADRLVGGLAIVDLLDRVHHVETMTSLAGFEALLRGLSVAVHGRPFYAGWGLTEDLDPQAARGRRLDLDELTAGALILYPRYIDPVAGKPCEPEHLLERLAAARDEAPPSPLALAPLRHALMRARYALLNPLVARLRARRGVGRPD